MFLHLVISAASLVASGESLSFSPVPVIPYYKDFGCTVRNGRGHGKGLLSLFLFPGPLLGLVPVGAWKVGVVVFVDGTFMPQCHKMTFFRSYYYQYTYTFLPLIQAARYDDGFQNAGSVDDYH